MPYVEIKRFGPGGATDMLVWGNGKTEWCKNLSEFTSWISVLKSPDEVTKFKKTFCEYISEDLGILFTIDDLDRIVTKKDYKYGKFALAEYIHIVDTNVRCFEQGKPPRYLATSLCGSIIAESLVKMDNDANR